MGQLASVLNNHPPERLLNDTQVPRMEYGKECKPVELRSEKELPNRNINQNPDIVEEKGSLGMEEESEDGWVELQRLVPLLD